MTALYLVGEVVCVCAALYGRYLLKGPRSQTLSPAKLSRYRWATIYASGTAALILVRLLTHTYK
jgi:hypothetical protein